MKNLFTVIRWDGAIVGLSRHIRSESPSLVLFDRDDTLVRDSPGRILRPGDVSLLPGVRDAVLDAYRRGVSAGVITNQSAVARGWLDVDDLNRTMQEVVRQIMPDKDEPHPLQFWIACPHLPDAGCVCRKPKPGMIYQAMALHSALSRVTVFGNSLVDVLAAQAAGAVGCQVRPGELLEAVSARSL